MMGKLCCAREHSVQFFVQFLYTVKLQFNLECMGPFARYRLFYHMDIISN